MERQIIQKEADLSPFATQWLQQRGFTVYAEVPFGHGVDLIGRNAVDALCCVELKLGLSAKVVHQACLNQLITADSWAFVARKPRKLDRAMRVGVGVVWFDGTQPVILLQPVNIKASSGYYENGVLTKLAKLTPGGVGGTPNLKGIGPAQTVYKAIQQARRDNPRITWKMLYTAIPNHYASARSMAGAMHMLEKIKAYKERRAHEQII